MALHEESLCLGYGSNLVLISTIIRATKNARHEIAAQSNKCNWKICERKMWQILQRQKMRDTKMWHNVAEVENAGNSA